MKEAKRSTFSGRLGFVLAAAGSAVGLGNLWRFPYLAAKYGGGIFLLIYIILAVTFGFTLMITEIAIGKKHTEAPWKHTVCSIKMEMAGHAFNTCAGYHSSVLLCYRRMGNKICFRYDNGRSKGRRRKRLFFKLHFSTR